MEEKYGGEIWREAELRTMEQIADDALHLNSRVVQPTNINNK